MSAAQLEMTYEADDEWTGEVFAVVKAGAFSAKGSAWFSPDQVKSGFVAKLRSYPLSSTEPPLIEGGGLTSARDQFSFRIIVRPFDLRGRLLVHADLASEVWEPRSTDLWSRASIRFLTEYTAVENFATELEQVLDGAREVAVLKGSIS
jgi:hypothetical protein